MLMILRGRQRVVINLSSMWTRERKILELDLVKMKAKVLLTFLVALVGFGVVFVGSSACGGHTSNPRTWGTFSY